MKKQFRDFESAREFVIALGLKNKREWREYVKSGNKPDNIPSDPYTYKNDFKGYGDWLGTGTVSVKDMQFQSFESARKFAQKLGLKNRDEWFDYCKSGNNPDNIPRSAGKIYKKDFKDWPDFLGYNRIVKYTESNTRPFEEARKFVRALNLKGTTEWNEYCKSGNKPQDIPSRPERTYEKDFIGSGDWLGTGTIASQDMKSKIFLSFKEARKFVRTLKLKDNTAWKEYCKSKDKPDNITSSPNQTYKNDGWIDIPDWLGNENLSNKNRIWLTYEECQQLAQKNNITSQPKWENFSKLGKRPDNVPGHPQDVYKKEWNGWGNFLGTGSIANQNKVYRSLESAREFVQKLGLKNHEEWKEYCKSGNKPDDIPAAPWNTYKKWKKK